MVSYPSPGEMLSTVLISLCLAFAIGAPEEDLITDLPGASFEFTFNQYSGYLTASDTRSYFYWFTESQRDPVNDPILLWLNGGPGCSSLLGFLTELGPFYVDQDGTGELHLNPYAWNTIANVLFLESPACVGFSYDVNGYCISGDNITAEENYNALQDFFTKFPEYLENEFYISGESYAGIYIPTLAVTILDGSYPINLQGYAIGNGFFDLFTNDNSLMFFAYYHAVLGDQLWNNLTRECCQDSIGNRANCEFSIFSQQLSYECLVNVIEAESQIFSTKLNPYNLISDCEPTSKTTKSNFRNSRIYNDVALVTKHNLRSKWESLDELTDDYDPACSVDNAIEVAFLNDPATRAALHVVNDSIVWQPCNNYINFNWIEDYNYTVDLIEYASQRIRVLIYNGDVDMVCNFLGNQWSLEDLQLPVLSETRKWVVDQQVAGYLKRYQGIDFVTVRGAGHMVPGYEPKASLHMLNSFLFQEPL